MQDAAKVSNLRWTPALTWIVFCIAFCPMSDMSIAGRVSREPRSSCYSLRPNRLPASAWLLEPMLASMFWPAKIEVSLKE